MHSFEEIILLNGESEIEYDGELSNVQAIQNASKAWIYGIEVGAQVKFSEHLDLIRSITSLEERKKTMELKSQ